MKKIILIAVVAFLSLTVNAQNAVTNPIKFASVNFTEIVQLMPEMDQARAALEENGKANEEILMSMYQEYQNKAQQFQQKSSTWTPAIRESKEKELMEIQSRLEQTQQSLQMEIRQLEQNLQQPIIEKAQKAISDIAKAKGFTVVYEESSLLYLDPVQVYDMTPDVRKAVNIPEGRTLEQLQQEMQAKAQAAQAQ